MPANTIEVSNVEYSWPGQSAPALILNSFQATAGQTLFIFGESGTGKSTLLSLLAGLVLPQKGSVNILGSDVSKMGARARDRFRARNIGFVFQRFNLIPYLDVASNIRLSAHLAGNRAGQSPERIRALLASLRMPEDLMSRPARSLSVGQQQRVALARAMVNKPRVLIADEPTSSLDHGVRDDFIRLLLELQEESSCTIIFVSHDLTLKSHFQTILDMNQVNLALELPTENENVG